MIAYFYETDFKFDVEEPWKEWLESAVKKEGFETGEINYIFCDDEYLLKINNDHLKHDYYTDVIGFQYSKGKMLSGDIFISVDRVKENAIINNVSYDKELARVMIHGLLHFMNYDDLTEEESEKMKKAEDKHLAFFDVLN